MVGQVKENMLKTESTYSETKLLLNFTEGMEHLSPEGISNKCVIRKDSDSDNCLQKYRKVTFSKKRSTLNAKQKKR
jgi:hypothetical protein